MNSSSKKMLSRFIFILFFCSSFFGFIAPANAQLLPNTTSQAEEEQEPQWPQDSLGRRTPRGTVSGFIKAVAEQNYTRASLFLNLKAVPKSEREGVAEILQNLLDYRGKILPYSWLSDEPTGKLDDNLPPNVDRVGSVTADGETINLLVEETKGPEGGPIWLFSPETIEKIATLSRNGNTLLVNKILPEVLEKNLWGGVPIGHWLILLILIFFSYLFVWGVISGLIYLLGKIWHKTTRDPTVGIIHALAVPFRLFFAVLLFVYLSQELGISIIIRQRFSELTIITILGAVLLLLWRLNDFITRYTERRMTQRGQFSAVSIIFFLRRFAKVVIIIVGIMAILGAFGVNVTAGIAALGIGGLALALGAQKSLENFVGSVTLIADRPIRIGDFCRIGDTMGTVEEIGMRSTRIRTLDRTVVTIPNGELSSTRIENYAHRDQFRFYTIFNFRYETTKDQMRYLLVELRKILYSHPKVFPDPARVRFIEFASASLNVEIFAYLNAVDFNDYVEIREDLLLRMMEVVERSGTGFAFPSQTIYLAKDEGLSPEKTKSAEEMVKDWKENHELDLPKFHPDHIEKLKDKIEYPPKEASINKPDKNDPQ